MGKLHRTRWGMIALLILVPIAEAAADNQALLDAERLAARGRLALVSGANGTAGAAFEKAYSIVADPAYLFAAGEAYTESTSWASAARVYTILAARPLPEAELQFAQEQLATAEAKLEGIRSRLAVHVNPADAQVEVDGTNLPFANPATSWLEAGSHVVRVSLPGFQTVEQVIEVQADSPSVVRIDLEKIAGGIGTLQVSSSQEKANVFIDGAFVGQTPIAPVQRPQGVYEVRVEKEGYSTWIRSVPVQRNLPTEVMAKIEKGSAVPIAVASVPVSSAPAPAPPVASNEAPPLVPVESTAQATEVPLAVPMPVATQSASATSNKAPPLVPMGQDETQETESPAPSSPLLLVTPEDPESQVAPSEPLRVVEPAPAPLEVEPSAPLIVMGAASEPETPEVPAEPVEAEETSYSVEESVDFAPEYGAYEEAEMSGMGSGNPVLIGWGWGLAGLGAAIAGAGYYFTMQAADSATKRDAVPTVVPEPGSEYNPTGELTQGDQLDEENWRTILYPYYWSEADTEAKANALLSYIAYGTGGAILVTGATLAIMGQMDTGMSDDVASSDEQPRLRWTGLIGGPTPTGWTIQSGLRF